MQNVKFYLGDLERILSESIEKLTHDNVAERIWNRDHTVWSQDPNEISNRLGWLDCSKVTLSKFDEIEDFVNEVKSEGFTNVLLMGMGGSSLAPEVFSKTFGTKEGYLNLSVIDSTHPAAVIKYENEIDFSKTLFIVSTKSGGTVETISFMKYFYNKSIEKIGLEKTEKHFVAVTDPGSGLEDMAKELNFRKIFINDPNIGGRYSALSLFGIVPATLIGVDIKRLFTSTVKAEEDSKAKVEFGKTNISSQIGALMSSLAKQGKDKLTFVYSSQIGSFGSWVEQLIAESTGKLGEGILPVDGADFSDLTKFSDDRIFVITRLSNDDSFESVIKKLSEMNFPVIEITIDSIYDYGYQFFAWEFATAVSGWGLGIQPFDQPNVESAKISARKVVKEYNEKGELPKLKVNFQEQNIEVTGDTDKQNLTEVINDFFDKLNKVNPKGYISLQSYTDPYGIMNEKLDSLAKKLEKKYKAAVTIGFGPRFLHSTGQLHKGDAGNGLFIQFLDNQNVDAAIPEKAKSNESSMSFGVLVKSQAMGDRDALINSNRKVLTLQFKNSSDSAMDYLIDLI